MRKKSEKSTAGFGIADGFNFDADTDISEQIISDAESKIRRPAPAHTADIEIDPTRNYSKYYTPAPKKGSKGGILGRGPVDASERKIQFSVTCTKVQKEHYKEAAQKDHRKLSDFICVAIEEYIENHSL